MHLYTYLLNGYMKNSRLRRYLLQKEGRKNELANKESIQANPDKHIDQDFAGFPHAPANEEVINPKTKQQKKTAAVDTKDGEKVLNPPSKKKRGGEAAGEEDSDGSAGAFEATERVQDDE